MRFPFNTLQFLVIARPWCNAVIVRFPQLLLIFLACSQVIGYSTYLFQSRHFASSPLPHVHWSMLVTAGFVFDREWGFLLVGVVEVWFSFHQRDSLVRVSLGCVLLAQGFSTCLAHRKPGFEPDRNTFIPHIFVPFCLWKAGVSSFLTGWPFLGLVFSWPIGIFLRIYVSHDIWRRCVIPPSRMV